MQHRKTAPLKLGVFTALTFVLSTSTVHAEDLDYLIHLLLENNPAVLAARRAVDAKEAMVTPARTLPDPSLSFQTMGNLLPPTLMAGDPSSARVLTFSQEIPFPGKLNLRGQIASTEAGAEFWKYEEVRREKAAELKMAYYTTICIWRRRSPMSSKSPKHCWASSLR